MEQVREDVSLYQEIQKTLNNRRIKLDYRQQIEFYEDQFKLLLGIYDNTLYEDNRVGGKKWVAAETIVNVIPNIEKLMDRRLSDGELTFSYKVWEDCMALASRESFHHFLLFMELDRSLDQQVYSNRIHVLQGMTYYLNKMENEIDFKDLVASFPPSYGKSFAVNYFSAWVLGRHVHGSILRMSYSDDLLNGFSRSIKNLIREPRFQNIFPRFKPYGEKPFSKDKDSDWLIKNADRLVSHYTRTRDGAVTGVRANNYIIFDDMTKGAEEASNDRLHDSYWDKYTTEWRNRKENDRVKELTIGTMWNPQDILGRKADQLEKKYKSREGKFKHTVEYYDENNNVRGVVIRVPLLDENYKSTCEDIYSTEEALELKENTDEFLFSCVYQQNPIQQKGRIFAYDELQQYEYEGNFLYHNGRRIQLSEYSYAALDPVRKGNDFVAMPIFKYDVDNPHIYYLIDVMFQGKSMDEVYGEITSRVLQHQIILFVIENNTDTSLRALVEKNLKERGYYQCDVIEKFNTKPKQQRIRDENLPIRKQLVFPKQGTYALNSELGKFMSNVTSYSLERPNEHDDAPDSLALFVHEIVKDGYSGGKVTAMQRPSFM